MRRQDGGPEAQAGEEDMKGCLEEAIANMVNLRVVRYVAKCFRTLSSLMCDVIGGV